MLEFQPGHLNFLGNPLNLSRRIGCCARRTSTTPSILNSRCSSGQRPPVPTSLCNNSTPMPTALTRNIIWWKSTILFWCSKTVTVFQHCVEVFRGSVLHTTLCFVMAKRKLFNVWKIASSSADRLTFSFTKPRWFCSRFCYR